MKLYILRRGSDMQEVTPKEFVEYAERPDWSFSLYGAGTEEDPYFYVAGQELLSWAALDLSTHVTELASGEEEKFFSNFIGALPNELQGHMILQMIGGYLEGDDERALKILAVDVAEVLGPDHAQTLFRFAKYVSKLA